MSGLSCISATFCMAVGGFEVNQVPYNYAEKWDGTAWSLLAMVSPAHVLSTGINAVVCSSPMACLAVGWYQHGNPGPGARPEAELWKGSSWSWLTAA